MANSIPDTIPCSICRISACTQIRGNQNYPFRRNLVNDNTDSTDISRTCVEHLLVVHSIAVRKKTVESRNYYQATSPDSNSVNSDASHLLKIAGSGKADLVPVWAVIAADTSAAPAPLLVP